MKKGLLALIVIIIVIVVGAVYFFIGGKLGGGAEDKGTPTPKVLKTEIRIKGTGTEMVIAPSKGRDINDIVTLKMEKVPADTKSVLFSIYSGVPRMNAPITHLGFDKDGTDGWLITISN